MNLHFILCLCRQATFVLTFILILSGCADDEFLAGSDMLVASADLNTTTSGMTTENDCLSCAYVVPPDQTLVDGAVLGLKPGDVIGLNANFIYSNLTFRNIVGTPDNPIIIRNCGGTVQIDATGKPDGIKTQYSKYFRITGGNVDHVYGIKVIGGHMGINLGALSTDFEVDHIEITNSGFAGIMAKTDPGCSEEAWRGNFLMENVDLHHNQISNTGGEGIYAGNSFFLGMNTSCGVKLPHEIHNINIYSNVVKNTGWDGIQLGCATKGASIYGNIVENYGLADENVQNNGIQIGTGTGGLCYNNLIRKGTGNGLIVLGLGDNIIFNNIIDEAGIYGIFCDERYSPGPGFKFMNNTIISPKADGIRIYAELVPMNVIVNNIIANPGSYSTYTYPRAPEDAFVYKLGKDVKIEMTNNYFTMATDSLRMIDLAGSEYRLETTSPVIDQGTDISAYFNVFTDFYGGARLSGDYYDVGAVEVQPSLPSNIDPVANGGPDITVTLPVNTANLRGSASDSDGTLVSYSWTQYGGNRVAIANANTPGATVSGLTEGKYYFRLTVTDNKGAKDEDNVLVTVIAPIAAPGSEPRPNNIAPVAYAGRDQKLELPLNTIQLIGSGSDSDGVIVSYMWTQYLGPRAEIIGADTATPTIKVYSIGKYYFRLTVKDNDGAVHYDNMLLIVSGEPITNAPPEANAGRDQLIELPAGVITLSGSGNDTDGSIVSYTWSQYGGPTAIINNPDSPMSSLSGLKTGKYYFRLTVQDNDGATDFDNMLITVVDQQL